MNDFAYRDPNRFNLDHYNQTTLHSVGIAILIAVALSVWLLPRRAVVFPLIFGVVLVAASQRVVIFGVDFQTLRILGLITLARFLARNELADIRVNTLDKIVFALILVPVPMTLLNGRTQGFMQESGFFLDGFTMYLVGRLCLREIRAIPWFIGGLTCSALLVIPAMLIEKMTAWNFFSFYVGVSEYSVVRSGKVRVAAAFAHPIILGVWFASSVPLAFCLLALGRQRTIQFVSALAAAGIFIAGVLISGTSTAVGATLASLGMLAWYPARRYTASCALILAVLAIGVHFASAKGLHHLLLTRFTFMAGSTGYHRYALIDNCMQNFGEWFLVGSSRGSYHWGYGMDDVTCQYVAIALKGGLLGLSLLFAAIVVGVRSMAEVFRGGGRSDQIVAYCIAVAILSHSVGFIGVSYFGQAAFSLYVLLGMTGGWLEGFRLRQSMRRPALRGTRSRNPKPRYHVRMRGSVGTMPSLIGEDQRRT